MNIEMKMSSSVDPRDQHQGRDYYSSQRGFQPLLVWYLVSGIIVFAILAI